jgi:hypothetical protein
MYTWKWKTSAMYIPTYIHMRKKLCRYLSVKLVPMVNTLQWPAHWGCIISHAYFYLTAVVIANKKELFPTELILDTIYVHFFNLRLVHFLRQDQTRQAPLLKKILNEYSWTFYRSFELKQWFQILSEKGHIFK